MKTEVFFFLESLSHHRSRRGVTPVRWSGLSRADRPSSDGGAQRRGSAVQHGGGALLCHRVVISS
jgi:hypothetical protein